MTSYYEAGVTLKREVGIRICKPMKQLPVSCNESFNRGSELMSVAISVVLPLGEVVAYKQ